MHSKRGVVGFETIAYAILAIIVIGAVSYITQDILFGESNLVRTMLGFGNISAFDKDIVERFEVTKGLNADAVSSVNALLYATNSLAVFDTYTVKNSDYSKYEKKFGDVEVKHTIYDRLTVYPSGTKDQISRKIVKNIIACEKIFKDKAYDNTRCFAIDTKNFGSVQITSEDIKKEFEKYYDDPGCDDKCRDYIFDLAGYYGYNPLNWIFNPSNWEWDGGLVLKKGVSNIRICGDDTAINEIHITTNTDNCKIPTTDQAFGFMVEGFNLPQEVGGGGFLTGAVERILNAYGDPQYIIYYEKFPQGEEEYWRFVSFEDQIGTILTVEGIFFMIDVGSFGLGRYALAPLKRVLAQPLKRLVSVTIRPLAEAAKRGLTKLTPGFLRTSYNGIKQGLGAVLNVLRGAKNLLADAAAYPFRALMTRQLTKELAEEGIERAARGTVEEVIQRRLGKNALTEMSEETIEEITQRYIRAFKNTKEALEEAGVDLIEGRTLSSNARQVLDSEVDIIFREIGPDNLAEEAINTRAYSIWQQTGNPADENFQQATKELLDEHNAFVMDLKEKIGEEGIDSISFSMKNEMSETAAEAGLRTPTRQMVQKYKSGARAADRLKAIIDADLTKEEREEVIERILKEGEQVLDNMNQRDVGKFLTHTDTKDVVDYVFKNGDYVWDIGGKPFTAAEKEAASVAFDEAVEGLAVTQQFKYAQTIESMFGRTTQFLNPLQKKRHLIAVAAVISARKIESMNAKFVSVGTNAFGLKIPYAAPVAYDEMEHVKTEKQRQDFFENFGEPGYQGMLPETDRYWMSLTRDRSYWWFDQDPARFHLVSPCKADVLMRVSTCTCIGKPIKDTIGTSESWIKSLFENQGVYETGSPDNQLRGDYPDKYPSGMQAHFDGETPSLFTLDENGNPIKQCNPSGEWFTFGESEYRVKCIKYDPVLDESLSQNYCYHGLNPEMSVASGILNYALPIGLAIKGTVGCAATVALAPVSPICGAVAGAIDRKSVV